VLKYVHIKKIIKATFRKRGNSLEIATIAAWSLSSQLHRKKKIFFLQPIKQFLGVLHFWDVCSFLKFFCTVFSYKNKILH